MADQKYTRADVAGRNGRNGAPLWVIIKDVVYDVSAYLQEHPGGEDVLREEAGKDATKEFESVDHSVDARTIMKKYKIGEIVEKKKKQETKSPVKTSNQVFPVKKPPTQAGPPPGNPPARPSVGLAPGQASCRPSLPPTGLSETIPDSLITPTGSSDMEACPSLAGPAFTPNITPVCIPPGSGQIQNVSASMPTPILASTGALNRSPAIDTPSCVQTNLASVTDASTDQEAAITKLRSSDLFTQTRTPSTKAPQSSPTNPLQRLPSTSTSKTKSSNSSVKFSTIQPGRLNILPGLLKVSLSPGKPPPKPAELPWFRNSQPAPAIPPPTFKSSTPSRTKMAQHDPYKQDKMPISSFKKK